METQQLGCCPVDCVLFHGCLLNHSTGIKAAGRSYRLVVSFLEKPQRQREKMEIVWLKSVLDFLEGFAASRDLFADSC